MTKGTRILMQKEREKDKATSNYKSTTCLPSVSKLLRGVIAEEICKFLDTNLLKPQEQKECTRKSRETNDVLFLDKSIIIGGS